MPPAAASPDSVARSGGAPVGGVREEAATSICPDAAPDANAGAVVAAVTR